MQLMESMIDYLDTFARIPNYKKNSGYTGIEWLDSESGAHFSIARNPVQGDGTISRDVLGNRIMQLSVMFSSQFAFNSDIGNASYNHTFFDELIAWIEEQNENKVYPELDDGQVPLGVFVTQTPYLFGVDPSNTKAQYSMIIQLQYKQLRKRSI